MSSYVCNDKTINKIVAGLLVSNSAVTLPEPLQFDDPREFGITLYAMNVNAVEQRYPNCVLHSDNLPGQVDAEGHHKPYTYRIESVGTMADFVDTLREYLYQCTEGNVSTLPLFVALDAFYEALKVTLAQEKNAARVEHQKEVEKTEYIGATETAKMIRAQLAKTFPGVKFYVKTQKYAGGASIDIEWMDGPADSEVKKITHPFSGKSFDGMNDYANQNDAWLLPDGSVIFAECESYAGDNHIVAQPHPKARRVHFGADYIFESRHFSPEFAKPIIKAVCGEFGRPEPKYYEHTNKNITMLDWDCMDAAWGDLAHHINREIRDRLNGKQPEIIIRAEKPATKAQQPEPVKKARVSSAPYGMKF